MMVRVSQLNGREILMGLRSVYFRRPETSNINAGANLPTNQISTDLDTKEK
jgi:hypothetical protein